MKERAGLYVHIPFCRSKCRYCDFFSVTGSSLEQSYIQALGQEIHQKRVFDLTFDTLYLGGGTPSILERAQLSKMIEAIFAGFAFTENHEVTIEANPGTVTRTKLDAYLQMGINRINIGVQSFHDSRLSFLGRCHTALEGLSALDEARAAGFRNIGLDLIIGVPGQDLQEVESDLEQALSFHPEHLSCYMLSYEPGAPFDRMRKNGQITPLDEECVGDMYELLCEFLDDQGYEHYEVSNFARRDTRGGAGISPHRSRHNQKYWRRVPYIGLGPSAHSFVNSRRFWNGRTLQGYIEALSQGRSPMAEEEFLTVEQAWMETVALGMRTREGVILDEFERRFGIGLGQGIERELQSMAANGYLFCDEKAIRLTRKGFLIADAIVRTMINAKSS